MSMNSGQKILIKWTQRIADIDRQQWDRLALPQNTPFLEWQWLHHLEASGCLDEETGWIPVHLTVWRDARLIAAAPLYIKLHSRGEFVFDHQWAEAAYRMGVHWYPKLLGTSPFTPGCGYRFMIDPAEDPLTMNRLLLDQIDRFCETNGIATFSAIHTHSEWSELLHTQLGVKAWLHHGLVWQNNDYRTFDDYLDTFKSKHRKNIKRDRRTVAMQGVIFEAKPANAWPEAYIDRMFRFYEETCIKYWGGCQYLNRNFFELLKTCEPQRVVLNVGFHQDAGDEPLAMSFLVHKGQRLYGRYWGSVHEGDGIHFEACYYSAIQYAIANGIQYYDAGSGNAAHKSRRGFPARPVYSLHRFYHEALDRLWEDNIQAVNDAEATKIKMINGEIKSPYPIYG